MDSGLRSRLAKGLSAQAFGKISGVFIQLASVPLLIAHWGADLYGAWLIIAAIPAYIAMSDLGFAAAGQAEMTMAVGRGDDDAAMDIFQGTWLLVTALSVAIVLVMGGLASFAPLADWFNIAVLSTRDMVTTLWLLGFSVLIAVQCSIIYAGFHAHGQYGLGMFLLAGIRLLEFILLAAAVSLGGGPVEAAAAWLAGRVIGAVVMRRLLRRTNPALSFGWERARAATLRRLAKPALASLGFPLGNALSIQGIIIVIGALFSPAAVVLFGTIRTMTRVGTHLVSALSVSAMAEISTAFGAGDTARVQKLHDRVCQLALWSAAVIAMGLLLLGAPLLRLWTLDAVTLQWPVFAPLLAAMVINGVSLASMMLVYSTNRHGRTAVVYVLVNAAVLGAAYILAPWAGLPGIAVCLLVAETVLAGYVISQSLALLDESPSQFLMMVLRPPLPMIWRFLKPK